MSSLKATSQASRFHESYDGVDLKQVNITVGQKDLLVDAHLQLTTGTHYGLLGRNGVGKTILMKCLATGQLLSVELRDQLRIMLISQTLDNEDDGDTDDLTVEQELHKTPFGMDFRLSEIERYRRLAQQRSGARGKEAREMLLQLEELNLNSQDGEDEAEAAAYDEDYERIDHSRVKDVLKKLKISEKMLAKKYTELSGGWKMRIQLAKSLLYDLDLLLLDEPTNHLDIAGVFWLQKVLTSEIFQGVTILMVSHNRSFLNAVAQSIVWFKNQRLEYYKGNYDTFLQTIQEKEQFAERYQSALDKKKATLEKSLIQSKKNAAKKGDDKKLKQLASRQTKLEERSGYMRSAKGTRFKLNRDRVGYLDSILGEVETVDQEKFQARLRFTFPDAVLPRSAGSLLAVEDVCYQIKKDSKVVFELKNITFNVEAGQRVAILGSNGQGKSTLLNLLADEWHPSKGSIQRRVLNVGYFRQEIVVDLGKVTQTPIERLTEKYPTAKPTDLWNHLGSFGLGSIANQTRLCDMSGGQRVAYAFSEITYSAPGLLLLDEPNSHLDLDALEALEDTLMEYEGGIVFVSHDISFVENVATSGYWMENGVLEQFELENLHEVAIGRIKS
ncbi:hypothetical protein MP638_001573 [Amoeboaphelidium occidentale]|nr:hypothetical protein MP638_001573 [Amoeboaphelidium occidentale]